MDALITRLISGTEEVTVSRKCILPGVVIHPWMVLTAGDLEMTVHRVVLDIDSGWVTVECDPWSSFGGPEQLYRDAVEQHLAAGFEIEAKNVGEAG